jgi:Kef-type K+ transport system membrane component KefB
MIQAYSITYIIFLIFAGTAILSTLALYTRQSLLVAYIALGMLFGPWGLKLVNNPVVIQKTGDIGIIFLLFLLGLDLQPQNLLHSLRKMSVITITSSLLFMLIGFSISYVFGYSILESIIIGIVAMFSSTIICLKLLPTTMLHHQHTGELVISILLLQDIIAIAILLILELISNRTGSILQLGSVLLAFPVLLSVAYIFQKYILSHLLSRFDRIHEYIFILSIGWCLFMAELSHYFGMSEEIGAFIAGVALASNPIAAYIAESLKPLRDFFLVIFFFAVGAGFNFTHFTDTMIPAFLLAGLMLVIKPFTFQWLLRKSGEVKQVSREIGVRLGQMSEFSLLVIYMAAKMNLIEAQARNMVEGAVIITFIVSCYWTVLWYPTPLAISDKLRRN